MNTEMIIENAKYYTVSLYPDENAGIKATLNGEDVDIPLDPANRHYAEIMRQVEAGELTIADAD